MTTITIESLNAIHINQQPSTSTPIISRQPGNSNNFEHTENSNPDTEATPDCCTQRINMCCFAINPPSFRVNIPQIDVAIQSAIYAQRLSALRFALGCNS